MPEEGEKGGEDKLREKEMKGLICSDNGLRKEWMKDEDGKEEGMMEERKEKHVADDVDGMWWWKTDKTRRRGKIKVEDEESEEQRMATLRGTSRRDER